MAKTVIITQKEGETRKDYLLRVAVAMLRQNAHAMDNVIFDEAECDASCLADDLESEFNLGVISVDVESSKLSYGTKEQAVDNAYRVLSDQIGRVTKIKEVYEETPNGQYAANLMSQDLEAGETALEGKDLFEMLSMIEKLKGWEM